MRVISLGWGTQSFGLAAMSALGELPPVDVAIHADTTHERTATYEFAKKWTPWLEERGVKVVTVHDPDTRVITPIAKGPANRFAVTIPAFTASSRGDGQVKRQCTQDWKIAPLRRWLQANREGSQVEQWLGITVDEIARVKPADVKYVINRWPFVEMNWRRSDVVRWLEKNGLEVPPRSACVFCPFQSRREWRALQDTEDWQKAVAMDEEIRKKRPPYDLFLHSSRIPLTQVDFRSQQEKGQMEFDLFDNECSGHCGI